MSVGSGRKKKTTTKKKNKQKNKQKKNNNKKKKSSYQKVYNPIHVQYEKSSQIPGTWKR